MISSLKIIAIFAAIFSQSFEFCFCACAGAEYEIDGECCSMCAPGNRVYRHCTEDTNTTCVPCLAATFIDARNGFTECFSCAVCDPGQGLRVKTACTQSSDTVCEPLDGHYCTDQHRGSCIHAERHTNCSPGQYIRHRGTAFMNTKCSGCPDGTFSNGSLEICQPHSKCKAVTQKRIRAGTKSSDTKCRNIIADFLIGGIISIAMMIVFAVVCQAVSMFCDVSQVCAEMPCAAGYNLARRRGAQVNLCSCRKSVSGADEDI